MKNKNKRRNKYELNELKRLKVEQATKGEGLYLFFNHNKGDVILIKPLVINGVTIKSIPPGKTFEGDSYYLQMVKANQLRLVKTIIDPNSQRKEKIMSEEKLLLDQPDRYTQQGKTEHVAKKEQLNENQPDIKNKLVDTLITEDPMAGVEIMLG